MKLPASYYNLISYIGTAMVLISLTAIVLMMVITALIPDSGAYIGIVIFIILPLFLVAGLALIPLGMWWQHKRAAKANISIGQARLIIDFGLKQHRNGAMVFIIGTLVFIGFTAVGSYKLYHYSESVAFCGTLCHEVMKPEYTAYQTSAHANITCAQCHIGAGAQWFVKSKISGLYQVYAVLTNSFPRPIPTPIENLRPARETCEQCHWPQKFYANSIRTEKHFLTDAENTYWEIQLKMKTGPEHSSKGQSEGIHWHINPNIKIDYIASDTKREVIPWVRYINLATSDTLIFTDQSNPVDAMTLQTQTMRTMDCMDCHNRPSHNYHTPTHYIDEAMAAGKISAQLPEIKRITMEILAKPYPTTDSALKSIENGIWDFYMANYPEVFAANQNMVKQAIAATQTAFSQNAFPEMQANWDAYPDHIGHREFNGCFRCHNNTHQANNGKTISNDCNLCHAIMQQGNAQKMEVAMFNASLKFVHPADVGEDWKEVNCSECHRYMY
jgi:hypothetical protein